MLHKITAPNGFTLVELLIVVTLMVLMFAMALPSFTTLLDTTRLDKAAAALKADIRKAQERAQREGRPVRVLFDTTGNTYQLQLANSASTPADCTDSNYTVFQTVNLRDTFHVLYGAQMTWPCLIFASTGRTALKNPVVQVTSTDTPYQGQTGWARFFNRAYSSGKAVNIDAEVVYWLNQDTIQVTADLQVARYLDSVCADLIDDPNSSMALLPDSVQLKWSNDGSTWLPASPVTVTGPFDETEIIDQYGNPTDRYQACPSLPIGQTVRYLRFTFAVPMNGNGQYIMALDEIKLPDPFVTLKNQSGRGSKTLTITPVTGKVSIQ